MPSCPCEAVARSELIAVAALYEPEGFVGNATVQADGNKLPTEPHKVLRSSISISVAA